MSRRSDILRLNLVFPNGKRHPMGWRTKKAGIMELAGWIAEARKIVSLPNTGT